MTTRRRAFDRYGDHIPLLGAFDHDRAVLRIEERHFLQLGRGIALGFDRAFEGIAHV
jgi:hypothetical protein